ncbi:hypothetical protein FSW04_11765 [Baekduia soli]|uniref:EfeO-type cupredoxin-like domain-containing protein n=1 Tax=Baekduia soli TaxID=496014 RepID=A0A5B8U5R1_9ACTN|nr:hypothetical protein [Baekduia soli]QEC48178.1 hypothetical protein FSW04_11765 [Baekduia soli]
MIARPSRPLAGLLVLGVLGSAVAVADARPDPRAHHARKALRAHGRTLATKAGAGRGWIPASLLAATSRPAPTGAAHLAADPAGPTGPTAAAPGPPTAPGDPAPDPGPPPPPAAAAVGVQLDDTPDYRAQLSRASVIAGSVTLQLQNVGEDPHNLRVVRLDGTGTPVDLPQTAPGASTTRTLALTAGQYYVYCTLTAPVSHEAAGMHATLTVTPAS